MILISLSRGSGELAHNNEKGIADALFMSVGEFRSAASCHLSPSVAYLGMALKTLSKVRLAIELDPIVTRWDHTALSMVEPLIEIANQFRDVQPGKNDVQFLTKIEAAASHLAAGSQGRFSMVLNSIVHAIRAFRQP